MLENGPHRLPPPPHRDPSDPCVVDVNYLRQIKTWVSEEKRQKFHPSLGPKYSVIEQGLSELEKRLYGYNFVDSFPTGYFAG